MRRFAWILAALFLVGTFGALYYAGWVVETSGQPQNQVLANAATFASMATASIAILVSALAIYLEKKRADERDDTGQAAWASAQRLAHAIYALDWTLTNTGGISRESPGAEKEQYFAALGELSAALDAAIEAGISRAFGVAWTVEDDGNHPGIATTGLLVRLQANVKAALSSRDAHRPATDMLIGLNAIYRAIASLHWGDFRSLWEHGRLPGNYATKERPQLMWDWGDDLFWFSKYILEDVEQRPVAAYHPMGITADIKPSLLTRIRMAYRGGYLQKPSLWWPAERELEAIPAEKERQLEELGVIWHADRTPYDVRAARFMGSWVGILGRTWPDRDHKRALKASRELVQHRARTLGADHVLALNARSALARDLLAFGGTDESIAEYRALLEDRRRIQGPDHIDTLDARHHLASALAAAGETQRALDEYRALLEDRRRIQGPDHIDTLNARHHLAWALTDVSITDARNEYQILVQEMTRVLGADDAETLNALKMLAWALRREGQFDEAIAQARALSERWLRAFGPEHPKTLEARNELAVAYIEGGRARIGTLELQRLADDQLRLYGADHVETFLARANLAEGLRRTGQRDEAISLLRALIVDRRSVQGHDHVDTLGTRAALAAALAEDGQVDSALFEYLSLVQDRARIQGRDAMQTLHTRAAYATALQTAERREEAIAQWRELLAGQERTLGVEHPEALGTRVTLAFDLAQAGQIHEASILMNQAAMQHERVFGPNDRRTQQVQEMALWLRGRDEGG